MISEWIICPICGNKPVIELEKILFKELSSLLSECKKETLINAKKLHITVIKEPDAIDAEPMNL